MKAIIAINNLHYIGLNGEIPWQSSDDLRHFKRLTSPVDYNGYSKKQILFVGHNTIKKLPKLKDRIVVEATDAIIRFLFKNKEKLNMRHYWCIGGAKTYIKMAPLFTQFHISYINDNTIGDTFAPDLNLSNSNPDCEIFRYKFDINK